MISLAQKKLGNKAILSRGDASHLPFTDRSFDLLTAKNVTRIHAGEIYRVLKPGGIFYASFKYGEHERESGGRFFADYTEKDIGTLTYRTVPFAVLSDQ